ncbi:hypothetical protein P280DRAFT_116051 [Massarina eburnea CBS 473.64]|uniref:Uncharacterized protein n=1 Tax=Massarina eburnea CBS 473.64 TaxID=1395130 RepID=A0A6A6SG92_9PLEO|nr:hypothetical protein P280DRAFT_116051 [Massarina eburnea CBS 473.64]
MWRTSIQRSVLPASKEPRGPRQGTISVHVKPHKASKQIKQAYKYFFHVFTFSTFFAVQTLTFAFLPLSAPEMESTSTLTTR